MWQIPFMIIVYYQQCNCCIGGEDWGWSLIQVDKKQHTSPLDGKFKKQRKKLISKALFILPKNSCLTVGYRIRVKEKCIGTLSKYYQLVIKPSGNVLASVSLPLTNWLPQLWSGSRKENRKFNLSKTDVYQSICFLYFQHSKYILYVCVCVCIAVCRKSICPTKLITNNIEWVLIMVNLH